MMYFDNKIFLQQLSTNLLSTTGTNLGLLFINFNSTFSEIIFEEMTQRKVYVGLFITVNTKITLYQDSLPGVSEVKFTDLSN
jgi:hypothetical protein